jgi:hypothetical protein
MKSRIVLILGAVALVALVVWMGSSLEISPKHQSVSPESIKNPQSSLPSNRQLESPLEAITLPPSVAAKPRTEESRLPSRRDFTNPLAAASFQETPRPGQSSTPAQTEAVFDQIHLMFRNFRSAIGESPVGTNAEIMKSIMGGNPKGAMLGPPEGQTVNGNGELLDEWGTPYFFHQLTSDIIEIRSAGPDQRLWNEDDVVSK